MTKYHISVKATFLEFVPLDATSESPLRRCRSCSPHWSPPEIEKGKRGGGASDSTAAETEDVVLNSSEDTEDCKGQPQVLYKKHRGNLYRKINKEISSAYCTQSLLNIIDRSLGDMNAVNLSTSIHRLARAIGSHERDAEVSRVLDRLLDAIEHQAVSELERGASKFSPRCATIIAWSCATLQVFRLQLFSVLMTISLQSLQSCQAYEVTNLLWAVAQLSKQSPEPVLMREVQELITASTSFFRDCDSLGQVKAQVLVSALVSVADLTVDGPSQAWLFQSLCEMLVPKCLELSFSSKTHIVMALQTMHGRDSHFVERLINSVSELCPELLGVSPLRTS